MDTVTINCYKTVLTKLKRQNFQQRISNSSRSIITYVTRSWCSKDDTFTLQRKLHFATRHSYNDDVVKDA